MPEKTGKISRLRHVLSKLRPSKDPQDKPEETAQEDSNGPPPESPLHSPVMPFAKRPQFSTLDVLPSELLLSILQNLDLTSLKATIKVYRRSRTVFSQYHKQIISHILSANLADPSFSTYFPQTFNDAEYPPPPEFPLDTSHVEAYTSLRWAKSLLQLEKTIGNLTTYIDSCVTPTLLPKLTPRDTSFPIPDVCSATETAITHTINRSLVINAQILFYKHPLLVHSTTNFTQSLWTCLPRPPQALYTQWMAKYLLPADRMPENLADELTSDDPQNNTVKTCYRVLRRMIYHYLTLHLKRHKLWKDNCVISSWRYMRDSVTIRDELFFFLKISPELLVGVVEVCKAEDDGMMGEAEVKKRYLKVAGELGKVYGEACEVTHLVLEERREREGSGATEVEQVEGAAEVDGETNSQAQAQAPTQVQGEGGQGDSEDGWESE
ncbi:hypothetical protein ABW19_dt0206455 [Dactylella cylindrospora]|nr:hypothetical protein ABW19_dt0206455 [Dactylella cylindrospora]